MNVSDYISLLNSPESVTPNQIPELERIIQDFPYFQSARALYLKGLYDQNSFKYNHTLKITAAHTADRSVLFDFITSTDFIAIQHDQHDQKLAGLWNLPVIAENTIVPAETAADVNELPEVAEVVFVPKEEEQQIVTETRSEEAAETFAESEPVEEQPAPLTGTPLQFTGDEVHSFAEWLQLSRFQPIDRTADTMPTLPEETPEKQKKNELIDRFIETNPKISKLRVDNSSEPAVLPDLQPDTSLMTETLARVYLEQKKYKKAIQAYEILILKYPEKSTFFADRISDIKDLQHINNL